MKLREGERNLFELNDFVVTNQRCELIHLVSELQSRDTTPPYNLCCIPLQKKALGMQNTVVQKSEFYKLRGF